jgi:hypothetical protein
MPNKLLLALGAAMIIVSLAFGAVAIGQGWAGGFGCRHRSWNNLSSHLR